MVELKVSISPKLVEPASILPLAGKLDVDSYQMGGMKLSIPNGIAYDVQLTNTGEGVVLSGSATCEAQTECARCLAPAGAQIEGEVEGYYLFEPAEELEDREADEFECVGEDGSFDIAPAIMAAIVHATPYVMLCKEDCAGLCPSCGANLNEGACACSDKDDIDPMNPFAALKDYDFGE